jgi:hypothetical protein
MYAAAGSVSLQGCTFQSNRAIGGGGPQGAPNGLGIGGGLYIKDPPSVIVVYLDPFTVAHALKNQADFDQNIHWVIS